jgi:hypothetical protein
LYSTKWAKGYSSISCECKLDVKGRRYFQRRFKRCSYDESDIGNTLFQKVKMPILKAIHILFRTATKKKGMSSIERSKALGVKKNYLAI